MKLYTPTVMAAALRDSGEGAVRNDRVRDRAVSLSSHSFKYLLRAYHGPDALLGIGNPV